MCKQDQMLEASINMGYLSQIHDDIEMCMVDVGVDTEQPLQYGLHDVLKVWWEWNACTKTNERVILSWYLTSNIVSNDEWKNTHHT